MPSSQTAISWEQVRAIFDYPRPPQQVWEKQFDYFDDKLQRLAKTPYDQIDFSDLWYYHHDLAYVELQPDLFYYLFPVCLMDWHESLMKNVRCSHGDSEFHYGVHVGKVLEKMVTPRQRQAIYEFFRDSFLERLDTERGFVYSGSKTPAYRWMGRFNSLAVIAPVVELLWTPWWSLETPGRAVAALQYCSGLMYPEGDNPLFPAWTKEQGGGGPYLCLNDGHLHDAGWMTANLDFLSGTLTVDYVKDKVRGAVARLREEPEYETARRLETDLPRTEDHLRKTVAELPLLLN